MPSDRLWRGTRATLRDYFLNYTPHRMAFQQSLVQQLHDDSEASGLEFFLVEDGEVVGETRSLCEAKAVAPDDRQGRVDRHS